MGGEIFLHLAQQTCYRICQLHLIPQENHMMVIDEEAEIILEEVIAEKDEAVEIGEIEEIEA